MHTQANTREEQAAEAAVLAYLATQQNMGAVPFTLAAVPLQERGEGKRRPGFARRAYEEMHTRIAEWLCSAGERAMARQR